MLCVVVVVVAAFVDWRLASTHDGFARRPPSMRLVSAFWVAGGLPVGGCSRVVGARRPAVALDMRSRRARGVVRPPE